MTKPAEQLYQERQKRYDDAIALRKPDRVPVISLFGFFPASYHGISYEEAMYDPGKMMEAWTSVIPEFAPDAVENPFTNRNIGPLLEALQYRQLQWPGHGVDPNRSYQFVEGEYMKAEEYDHFLADQTDFMMRVYWPRTFGALEPFGALNPLAENIAYIAGIFNFGAFGTPEMEAALESLLRAARAARQSMTHARAYAEEMKRLGFPLQSGGLTLAPYDAFSNFFRGTRGAMMDMYRHPKKLQAALEKLLPIMVRQGTRAARASGTHKVFIPLHKGQEGFMSIDQYRTFYWPTLRQLILALIEEGLTPCPLAEGHYSSRLEILADVPPGKVCYAFESEHDILQAAEALRGIACIRGGVPLSLLCTGTPERGEGSLQAADRHRWT